MPSSLAVIVNIVVVSVDGIALVSEVVVSSLGAATTSDREVDSDDNSASVVRTHSVLASSFSEVPSVMLFVILTVALVVISVPIGVEVDGSSTTEM